MAKAKPVPVKAALDEAKRRFREAGIPTPELDAEVLLAYALNVDRAQLLLSADAPLSRAQGARYDGYVARRLGGFCVAYIVGQKEFRGIAFRVTPDVLVPRPDTETLVEAALELIDGRGKKRTNVLDLCCGSGAVALALRAERPHVSVCASDVSAKALRVARLNGMLRGVIFIEGDLFDNIDDRFDLIVSNPPYVPSATIETLSLDVQNEPRIALDGGEDGLDIIRKIVAGARKHLSLHGTLLLEADPGQMGEIAELMRGAGFVNIAVKKDLAGLDRVISGG
jgi:release factor glutamine methyltransferase